MKNRNGKTIAASVAAIALICALTIVWNALVEPALFAQADAEFVSPTSGSVLRAGDEIQVVYAGTAPKSVHILRTSDDLPRDRISESAWEDLDVLSQEDQGDVWRLRVRLPEFTGAAADTPTTDAQIRVEIQGNQFVYSQPFVVDGTDPACRLSGKTYVRRTTEGDRLMIGFVAVGPDVASVRVRLVRKDGPGESKEFALMPPSEALETGFDLGEQNIEDGVYDVIVTVLDKVGNESDPRETTINDFVIDTTAPELSVRLDALGGYVLGGESHSLTWSVNERYPDYDTFRLEYVEADSMRVRGTIKADASEIQNGMTWTVPYEDIGRFKIRVSMRDGSGNKATALSNTFTMFSQPPQAVISDDSRAEGTAPIFTIKYIPQEPLMALLDAMNNQGFDFKVDVWTASSGTSPISWNESDAITEGNFRPGTIEPRSEMKISVPTTSTSFAARLVIVPTGSGRGMEAYQRLDQATKDHWNALTEPAPETDGSNSTSPEAVWTSSDRLARVTLKPMPGERAVYLETDTIVFEIQKPRLTSDTGRARFEYRPVGSDEWLLIQEGRIRDLGDTIEWMPGEQIPLCLVRVVTTDVEGGQTYEVFDVLSQPLTVDSDAPVDAAIVRVTDADGLAVTNGQFTSSPYLDVEYRGTDTVNDKTGSGIKHFRLWDTAPAAFYGAARDAWNNKVYSANLSARDDARQLPATAQEYRLDFTKLAANNLSGVLTLLIEGEDYAGNNTFGDAGPSARELNRAEGDLVRPARRELDTFTVLVDRVSPSVRVWVNDSINDPDFSLKPGQDISIGWDATDIGPNGENGSSMPNRPVVIYVLDQNGRRSRYEDNLPVRADAHSIAIPAIAGASEVSFLVTAIDHAGNESSIESDSQAITQRIRITNPQRPNVKLDRPTSVVNQLNVEFAWSRVSGAPMDEIAAVVLWESVDGGMTWRAAKRVELEPGQDLTNPRFSYTMERIDGDHHFALTGVGADNLGEPEPTAPVHSELNLYVDDTAPVIEGAKLLPEEWGQQPYVTDGQPSPTLVFTVNEDVQEHFDEQLLHVWVTTPETVDAPDDQRRRIVNIANRRELELALPRELPGAYTVRIEAEDSVGNVATPVSFSYRVRTPSQWEFTTSWVGRTDPLYWRVPQRIEWTRQGERSAEPIRLTFRSINGQHEESYTTDDIGSYQLEGVPELPNGEYELILRAVDASGKIFTTSMGPFMIEKPDPVVRLVIADDGSGVEPPMLLEEGMGDEPDVWGISGNREVRFRLKVYHRRPDGSLIDYPLPPYESRVERAISIFYRYSAPGGQSSGATPTQQVDDMFFTGPSIEYPVLVMGDFEVGLNAQRQDGRYAFNARFRDNYGFRSAEVRSNTQADVVLVYDTTAPEAQTDVPSEADGQAPTARVLRSGVGNQIGFEARDPNLDPSSLVLEVRPYGEPNARPKVFPLTRDPATGELLSAFAGATTSVSGTTKVDFRALQLPAIGDYAITLVAADRLGNVARVELGEGLFAGRADYFAVRPVEDERYGEAYTSQSVSRHESFRVLVNRHHPWPSGLSGLRLWARHVEGEWQSYDFPNVTVKRNETSLPFTADREGEWLFIITSRSNEGYSEIAPGLSIDDLGVEKRVMVYFGGLQARELTLHAPASASDRVIEQFNEGELVAGVDYEITWKIEAGVRAHQTDYKVELSTDAGASWGDANELSRSRSQGIGLYEWAVEDRVTYADGVESITYRALWRCPDKYAGAAVGSAVLRLTASERSNSLPELSDWTKSISYRIEQEQRPVRELPDYYIECRDFADALVGGIERAENDGDYVTDSEGEYILDDNGNKITRELAIDMALEKYRSAKRELDTAEIQDALSAYYKLIDDQTNADYHHEQALLRHSEDEYIKGMWDGEDDDTDANMGVANSDSSSRPAPAPAMGNQRYQIASKPSKQHQALRTITKWCAARCLCVSTPPATRGQIFRTDT